MDLQKIKKIVNSGLPDQYKESAIITILSQDKKVVPTVLKILESERNTSKELITDMNMELGRAHIFIEKSKIKEKNPNSDTEFNKKFLLSEITKFYTKYKEVIGHCFNKTF